MDWAGKGKMETSLGSNSVGLLAKLKIGFEIFGCRFELK
jgi:hypothetical protein